MFLDSFSPKDVAESLAAFTVIGGAIAWTVRKLRNIHKQLTKIWLFLVGDEEQESLIDRILKEEFRSRFMLMHTRDGIFECDGSGQCTYVNPTLAKTFGLEATEMLGNGWLAGILPSERARVWESWKKAVSQETPYEEVYTLKSGRKLRVLAHTCYGADRKRPLYFIGVVWDAQAKPGRHLG